MFTPFSKLFACRGEGYHGQISRERLLAGWLLASIHPKVGIDFLWQIATLADSLGDEKKFRKLMRQALSAADHLERRLPDETKHLLPLVHFYTRLLDFTSARRVIDIARARAPQEAASLQAQLEALEKECASWRWAIDAAGQEFRRRLNGQEMRPADHHVDVYIPANGFGVKPLGYDGFQADIRRAFGDVIAILQDEGHAIFPRLRFATHGRVRDESRPFVSYHSVSATDHGLHIKESDRRSFFSADRGGYSGWANFASQQGGYADGILEQEISAFIATERAALINGNVSKYDQPASAELSFSRPYVFVALQVMDDAVQRLSNLHMFDMLEEVCNHCEALGLDVVVKRHPKCKAPAMGIALRRGTKLGKFKLSDASIHDLISAATAVCVTNSSVGLEALWHGKPVYCFGGSEYQQACFQIHKGGDFARLFQWGALPRPQAEIDRILYALRHEYSANVRDEGKAKVFWRSKLNFLTART